MIIKVFESIEGTTDRSQFLIDTDLIKNKDLVNFLFQYQEIRSCGIYYDQICEARVPIGKEERSITLILVDEYNLVNGVQVPFAKGFNYY